MPASSITTLSSNDLMEVGELLKQWSGKPYNCDFIPFNSYFTVARDKDWKPIGVAQLIVICDPFFNRKVGLVENVFVLPEYRRQGIAKQIMEAVFEQAETMECELVKLTTRKEAGKALYRNMGMEEGCSFYKEL